MEKEERNVESMSNMIDILQELTKNIEPLFNKALEEKVRLTGYAQGVEQVIKIIAARVQHLREQVESVEKDSTDIIEFQQENK